MKSLTRFGFPPSDLLADPMLELHGPDDFATISNNDWKDSQETVIENSGLAPKDDLESAIDVTLSPGAYTAILRGNSDGVGIGSRSLRPGRDRFREAGKPEHTRLRS